MLTTIETVAVIALFVLTIVYFYLNVHHHDNARVLYAVNIVLFGGLLALDTLAGTRFIQYQSFVFFVHLVACMLHGEAMRIERNAPA